MVIDFEVAFVVSPIPDPATKVSVSPADPAVSVGFPAEAIIPNEVGVGTSGEIIAVPGGEDVTVVGVVNGCIVSI